MATGIIGAITNGTLVYLAPVDAKLIVSTACSSNAAPVTINGIPAVCVSANTNVLQSHFVGAGQLVIIVVPLYASCIVSVLEGS
ncbi:hypothetical protein Jab_1c25000 [Janthinobacterium sp. HH01]|uniref:hypothetical protein n=1 Tax=Janthinobacterium sp. HH01 TaxID=1198452 RepID=UPI0002AEA4BE|nr:hypothetical protein [Janthinobacterium sp. HH01]ELX13860.1 hypothetical protein Jab_1c25000 [Janthinobacterium sp. HH01]